MTPRLDIWARFRHVAGRAHASGRQKALVVVDATDAGFFAPAAADTKRLVAIFRTLADK